MTDNGHPRTLEQDSLTYQGVKSWWTKHPHLLVLEAETKFQTWSSDWAKVIQDLNSVDYKNIKNN